MAWLKINKFNFPVKVLGKKNNIDAGGYKRLEDYGVVGNLETCALIGVDGSVDWLCLPHLESPSVFGALLDKDKGGFFSVRPAGDFKSLQNYAGKTNVLETHFSNSSGAATITDFMPPFKKRSVWHKHQTLFRKVKCTRGTMDFSLDFKPRFNYAKSTPRFKANDTGIEAYAGKYKIFLDANVAFQIEQKNNAVANFSLNAGQELWLILQYNSHRVYSAKEAERELRKTLSYWKNWSHKCEPETCVFAGPWHDLAVRSGLVLKLLTHGETGAIAAAATTSLPEITGGIRNWDYRFNWIRDSVFTAQALYNLGNEKEAKELFNWYKRIYKGVNIKDIQIMTGLHGEKNIPEKTLKHLSGYRDSKPVRIGNAAAKQAQLDIYGELLNIAYETNRYGESISQNDWRLLKRVVNYVCEIWKNKDAGIWEMRHKREHFVYSKVMCWVAIDRGIKIAEKKAFKAPLEQWRQEHELISKSILENGFSKKLNSFSQTYGSENLDASNLLIPMVGFLPFEDPRVQGTINAVLKHLTKESLVYRYLGDDGLPGQEGGFILCANWLIDALALSGRIREAEKLYKRLLRYASPLGLLAEEINLKTKQQQGNYPQAFSHVGLINSALYLGLAKGKHAKKVTPTSARKSFMQFGAKFKQAHKFLASLI
jgi:GH15 family glucan-1,4-alpha-glucosidase